MQTARDATFSPANTASADTASFLWVATSGGVFKLNYQTQEIVEYRNIEALQSLDATAIHSVSTGQVFVGGSDGALDIFNANAKWTNITDIKRATEYPKRGINDITSHDGILYLACDFGLVSFDYTKNLFVETIDRIGTLQEKTRVNAVTIRNDSVWVASDSGVAVAPLDVTTLRLPSVWMVLDTNSGVPNSRFDFIETDGTVLAAVSGNNAYVWQGTRFDKTVTTPDVINGLSLNDGTVSVSTIAGMYTTSGLITIPWTGQLTGHASFKSGDEFWIVGFVKDKAIQLWNGSTLMPISINTPISNQFARIGVDIKGGLWIATDIDPPRTGFGVAYFNGTTWRNYTPLNSSFVKTNAVYRMSPLANGTVIAGTWGSGGVRFTVTGDSIVGELLDRTTCAVQGLSTDPNYQLVADAALDRNGTTWLVNEVSASQLVVSLPINGESAGYSNCTDPRNNAYRSLAVDGAGNKWVGSWSGTGIVAYNDKNTPSISDDVCNAVRTSNSQLPDNVINVLKTDKAGALWIGTAKGVAVISSPTSVSNTSVPYVRKITALSAPVVNDIYVDALNYKWIATTGGVFVLNEDGTEVLASITRSNAPLLDDNIRCVAVDDLSGKAYFGTSFGCSVVQTSSIRPDETFNLSFYPQPFSPDNGEEVVLNGLAEDSDVRIMTAGGFLVYAVQARGKQATWDGRDIQGRISPPGVYVVVAKSATTGESAVGKIVVK